MAGGSILVGTTKGAFILRGQRGGSWRPDGPFCAGWPINHAVAGRDGTIWAGGGSTWTGAGIWRSDDRGATWQVTRLTSGLSDDWARNDPDFAAMIGWIDSDPPFGTEFEQIWSLAVHDGTLFAGTKPARLLRSDDGGRSFSVVGSLTGDHGVEGWQPGGAGLTLHTIVGDPDAPGRLWVGVSAAGVFASEDGGAAWTRANRLSNAGACSGHDHPAGPSGGEIGHCVHNMVLAPGGRRLYQQNHHGVWRSNDGARSWEDITAGLPSTFGFPVTVHPRDPDTLWVLPLNGDMAGRFPPDAAAAVWRSRDGGDTWSACRRGLPQEDCFFTVLRQAMAVDASDPAGIYFGTNSGSVFASFDEGDTWEEIARHLPTILSIEVAAQP